MSVAQLLVFTVVLLAIVAVVVIPFLLYLYHRDRQQTEADKVRLQSLHDVGAACHTFQREMNKNNVAAFDALAKVIESCNGALVRNSELLRRLEDLMTRQPTGGSVRT